MGTKTGGKLSTAPMAWAGAALALVLCGSAHAALVAHERAAFTNIPADVRTLAFSADGKYLAVCTGITIKIWNWQKNEETASIPGGAGAVFSTDSALLAYPGNDEFNNDGLMIWDLGTRAKRTFIADDNVRCPVFLPDGKNIAGAVGSKVKIWDVATGKELAALNNVHKSSITAVAGANEGKAIISGDARGLLALWDIADLANPKKVSEFKRPDDQGINAICTTRGGSVMAACTGGGEILVLETSGLKAITVFRGTEKNIGVKSVSISPDNRLIASACSGVEDLDTKLWDVSSHALLVGFLGHQNGINCVSFSPDGRLLATGSDDKTAKVWDVSALLQLNVPKPEPSKKKAEKSE